jgi:hypothetical protein
MVQLESVTMLKSLIAGNILATSAMMVPWWPRAGPFYRLHHEFQS